MVEIASVYRTKDYDRFKKLKGNRTVLDTRKRLLISSIKERGWIRNPITVNEHMEIIDGQGRFEALKELGLPIEFVISNGATIHDCIALNIKQRNWSNMDYINSYAENGFENYITLLEMIKKYPEINVSTICVLCGFCSTDGAGTSDPIKNGVFAIYNKEHLEDRIVFFNKVFSFIGRGNGRERTWATAIKFIFDFDEIDNNDFLTRLEKRRAFINPVVNTKQALECFETIVNYGRKNKMYLLPGYDKWLNSSRVKNLRRISKNE